MRAKDVALTVGQSVTLLTGIAYTISRVTAKRVWLTRAARGEGE